MREFLHLDFHILGENKRKNKMATTWTPEQNGNTGRMIFVDCEVIYVDDETHLVDESDVFIKET